MQSINKLHEKDQTILVETTMGIEKANVVGRRVTLIKL